MHQSDSELVRLCRSGSEAAWCQLVDRFGRLVYSIPRRYGMSTADAEDVVQLVFTILFRRLHQLDDATRLSAWLITTTQRECWRHIRQSRSADIVRSGANPDDFSHMHPEGVSPEEQADIWEQQHLVRQAMSQLGGKCEELLTALFLASGDQSYEVIARKLDMPVGSIGPTRARCFAKLETILTELGFEPDP